MYTLFMICTGRFGETKASKTEAPLNEVVTHSGNSLFAHGEVRLECCGRDGLGCTSPDLRHDVGTDYSIRDHVLKT